MGGSLVEATPDPHSVPPLQWLSNDQGYISKMKGGAPHIRKAGQILKKFEQFYFKEADRHFHVGQRRTKLELGKDPRQSSHGGGNFQLLETDYIKKNVTRWHLSLPALYELDVHSLI